MKPTCLAVLIRHVVAVASHIPHPAFRVYLRGFLKVNPFNRIEIIAQFKYNQPNLPIASAIVYLHEMQARHLSLENSTYDFPGFTNDTWPAGHTRHFFFEPEQKGRAIIRRTIRPTRLSIVISNELPSPISRKSLVCLFLECPLSEPFSTVSPSSLVESAVEE